MNDDMLRDQSFRRILDDEETMNKIAEYVLSYIKGQMLTDTSMQQIVMEALKQAVKQEKSF